ncbi:MAG: outer membrane beta-barrel protein [Acidobacteriota bacterium]
MLLAASWGPALARNEAGDWELGVHLGQTSFIDGDALDNDSFWGVNVGYSFNSIFELALNYDSISTEGEGFPKADLKILTLDFIFNGGKDSHRPFFLIGVGMMDQDARRVAGSGASVRADKDREVIELGLGYRGYLNRVVGIRVGARLFFTDSEGNGFGDDKDLRFSYGLAFNLSR